MTEFNLAALHLPEDLPIFPLSGALLLPRGHLPLNIFEPRYLAMTDDALGEGRLIGMIQPNDPDSGSYNPPVYQTGCVGRITAFLEEGSRYLITLTGVCRFDVRAEQPMVRGYRRVIPDWAPYVGDFEIDDGPIDRSRLLSGFKALFARHEIKTDWSTIEQAKDGRLVTLLAMIAPFGPVEKQSLLVARTTEERAKLLIGLVEMGLSADHDSEIRH
jgi:Lon protease-like protein